MSGLGTALATPGLLLCLPAQCRRFFLLYVRAALCRSHGVNDIHWQPYAANIATGEPTAWV